MAGCPESAKGAHCRGGPSRDPGSLDDPGSTQPPESESAMLRTALFSFLLIGFNGGAYFGVVVNLVTAAWGEAVNGGSIFDPNSQDLDAGSRFDPDGLAVDAGSRFDPNG